MGWHFIDSHHLFVSLDFCTPSLLINTWKTIGRKLQILGLQDINQSRGIKCLSHVKPNLENFFLKSHHLEGVSQTAA